MINLCTSPSLTTKQLLDIISTDLIRLLCYCFLEFYWLLGDKSKALKIILWLYITLCANFHVTELQARGHFSVDPCFSSVSVHGSQTHAAVVEEVNVGIISFLGEGLIFLCCSEKTLSNVPQQLHNTKIKNSLAVCACTNVKAITTLKKGHEQNKETLRPSVMSEVV